MLAAIVFGLYAQGADLPPLARSVTISRDKWGVPHITGPTDAGVVFGLMVAQAEDNFAQLEDDAIHAIGRAAEVEGEAGLANDLRVRAFEIERHAKETLAHGTPAFRKLAGAYADGLNWYLHTHPGVHPKLIRHFEPWFFMANVDLPGAVDGVATGTNRGNEPSPDTGSNAWAIAPSRMRDGRATLFLNPHVGLFGRGQRYEAHLTSVEGLDVSGFAILGQPMIHSGYNRRLAWTHTNTRADGADAYLLRFDDPSRPLAYRYGGGHRLAEEREEIFRVRTAEGVQERKVRFLRSHYGPVFATRDGDRAAIRIPVEQATRYAEQKLAMAKARNMREFVRALDMHALTYSNTTYADADGNIAFWYGNVVPRRDASFDWTRPVDGSDPRTEWRGYHSASELPHVVNPKAGFVQNCNSDPWHTSSTDNPAPEAFPSYVVRDKETTRAQNSRRILTSQPRFSYEELERLAFDTYVFTAAERVPSLVTDDSPDLAGPLAELRTWDYRSSIHSVASTLYFETELELMGSGRDRRTLGDKSELLPALRRVVDRLRSRWGTWRVPWGLINRVQRVDSAGKEPFSEDRPSLPSAGAPSVFGQIFALGGTASGRQRFGTVGDSYVALVQPGHRARSVCGFGQSADPASPHFFDQAPLYAAGRFKDAALPR